MKKIEVGSDFSGVGAFEQALKNLNIKYKNKFACDSDKFVRKSYLANYEKPEEYPFDVYERKIPEKSIDLYMTSPPCQSFSLAGNRKGEKDDRGVLFYNSHEFIKKNKPRFFIFENVKGLVSDNQGNTFKKWLQYLGGKSINGAPVLFPYEKSVPYHIYYRVLNSKDYGVPQNRERVFVVGIRDDSENFFSWPKKIHLKKKLSDLLEQNVEEKHFLSHSAIKSIIYNEDNLQKSKVNPEVASALQCPGNSAGIYKGMNAVRISENTKKGFVIAKEGDSINFGFATSKTRRGRLGKSIAQTLDTCCNQATIQNGIRRLTPRECFRLQDFPEDFKFVVSDTQLYKQAGNSITVSVLENIISKLQL